MANANLIEAKAAKNDEFYTELPEISAELNNYTDKFQGKVVICNCDDPAESNFVKYFLMNFNRLGLKELIATGYQTSPVRGKRVKLWSEPYAIRVTETKSYLVGTQTDLDAKGVDYFLTTERDRISYPLYGNYAVDENGERIQIDVKEEYIDEKTGKKCKRTVKHDLYYEAGDFRSDMCVELLQQADIVVTNPPFSLFREYVAQLVEYGKQFLILGSLNAITYKEFFPLLKNDQVWLGCRSGAKIYQVSSDFAQQYPAKVTEVNGSYVIKMGNTGWFTNLDHAKRHQVLPLDLGFTYYGHEDMYPHYDNYDAIEVGKVNQIPCDYEPCWYKCPFGQSCAYAQSGGRDVNAVCEAEQRNSGTAEQRNSSISAMVSLECQSRSLTNTAQSSSGSLEQPRAKAMDSPQVSGMQIPELHNHLLPVNGSTSGCSFRKCNGVMGVPITFLDSYCPEQFEILGYTAKDMGVPCLKFYENLEQSLDGGLFVRNTKSARFSPMIVYSERPSKTCYRASNVKGFMLKTYGRILIRRK